MWLIQFRLKAEPEDLADGRGFRSLIDVAYAELCGCDRVLNPDMTAVLAEQTVTYSVLVDTEDRNEAFDTAHTAVKSSLHGAGAYTSNFRHPLDRAFEKSKITTEPAYA